MAKLSKAQRRYGGRAVPAGASIGPPDEVPVAAAPGGPGQDAGGMGGPGPAGPPGAPPGAPADNAPPDPFGPIKAAQAMMYEANFMAAIKKLPTPDDPKFTARLREAIKAAGDKTTAAMMKQAKKLPEEGPGVAAAPAAPAAMPAPVAAPPGA